MDKYLSGENQSWCSTRISFRSSLIFDLYNDLPDGITSICKIFADDTSLFSKVLDVNKSVNELNSVLERINQWATNGKCNLSWIPKNKQMKLFFLVNQFHMAYLIRPLSLMKEILKNVIITNI